MAKAAILLAVVATVLAGCGGGGGSKKSAPTPSKPGAVAMKDIQFKPAVQHVTVGHAVTWTNQDSVDHNVTATKGARFTSKNFGQGGTFTFTPRQPGTIEYVCTLHPGMKAKLIVTR